MNQLPSSDIEAMIQSVSNIPGGAVPDQSTATLRSKCIVTKNNIFIKLQMKNHHHSNWLRNKSVFCLLQSHYVRKFSKILVPLVSQYRASEGSRSNLIVSFR